MNQSPGNGGSVGGSGSMCGADDCDMLSGVGGVDLQHKYI